MYPARVAANGLRLPGGGGATLGLPNLTVPG